MTELEELRLAYAECSRQRFELLAKLKNLLQETEPVAWRELLREARDNCKASIVEEGISASRKEYRIDLEARLTAALNTSPPKREWQGLTDEEIEKTYETKVWDARRSYARAIEAKLKAKNGFPQTEKNT